MVHKEVEVRGGVVDDLMPGQRWAVSAVVVVLAEVVAAVGVVLVVAVEESASRVPANWQEPSGHNPRQRDSTHF